MTIEGQIITTYPVLKSRSMDLPRLSILSLVGKDDKEDLTMDRARLVNFINSQTKENNEKYFYGMMPSLKFILEGATAYTTPNKIVHLNYPCVDIVPMNKDRFRRWYFVFCHECLHQMWDTFAVGDKIKKVDGACNHTILNIASDVVINDYLRDIISDGKLPPIDGWFPETLKDKWNVEYDRKVDTQFTLYEKIMKLDDSQISELEKIEGKINPPHVEQQDVTDEPEPPQPPKEKHTPSFIKGWTQAIKDAMPALEGKDFNDKSVLQSALDTLKDLLDNIKIPSDIENSDEYTKGYNAAIKQLVEGITKGITVGKGKGKSGGDLPPIPWDTKQNGGGGGGDNQDNTDDNNTENDKNNDGENGNNANDKKSAGDAAQKAKDAAKKAQDAADNAKNKKSSNNSSVNPAKAQVAADEAAKAAKEAQDAANEAENAAARGDKKGEEAAAKKAKDAMHRAEKAAQEAKDAAGESKSESEGENSDAPSHDAGSGDDDGGALDNKEIYHDMADAEKRASEIAKREIQKAVQSASGPLRDFLKKCKASAALQKNGLMAESNKGTNAWDKQLELQCFQFVHKRLHNPRYERKYGVWPRGERAWTAADSKNGRIVNPGRRLQRNKVGFDVNLYIDTSGSMGSDMPKVFKTAYAVVDTLVKKFSADQFVDGTKLKKRTFIFTNHMKEIPYGDTVGAGGITYNFHDLMQDIQSEGTAAMLNIVVSDGAFPSIDNNKTCNAIAKMEGMFVLVVNAKQQSLESLRSDAQSKIPGKFSLIYAPGDWSTE